MEKYKASKFILSSFFTMPYALFDNPYYSNVSNEAKLLYGLVIDRISLSIKNKEDWVDENNEVYCYYTNEAMQKILNRSKPFVIKLKKELHQAGLLLEVQQGMNKPNRIYPLEVKTVNLGSKQFLLPEVKTVNPNHTNINHTNINHTEFGTSASTTTGGNTLFSIANQNSSASPVVVNDLGKLNNLILENFGKQPTPLQVDDMRYMLEENSLELLTLAVKEAVNNGRPYFSYLQGILNNWKHDGLNTPELVKNRVKPRANKPVTMLDNGYDEKLGI